VVFNRLLRGIVHNGNYQWFEGLNMDELEKRVFWMVVVINILVLLTILLKS